MAIRDRFAEMYVAGLLADCAWNIYFPNRDHGFDFIITKTVNNDFLIRPVQVKGKYATQVKGNTNEYGYVGKLTQFHDEMVLAIPFFSLDLQTHPIHVAFMPRPTIKPHSSRGHKCAPATFRKGVPAPRRDYQKFFDTSGICLLDSPNFKNMKV